MKKNILITGGASGIGLGIVNKFASNESMCVILTYNNSKDEAMKISAQKSNVHAFEMDVTDPKSVNTTSNELIKRFGSIDCIVNNAGGNVAFAATDDYSEKNWDETFNLNCKSVFLVCKNFIPDLNEDGSIINISSISGKSGGAPGGMAYAASKAAVDCMTKSLAKELAPRKIRVNAISPGIVYTNQHRVFSTPEYYQGLVERVPLMRDGKVEDIANLVYFLVSDLGSYITGQNIDVNGGMLMG